MDESLIKRVKSFPPLDETIMKIQEIANRKNSSLRELTGVVEKDPMLTANILKATNSPLYGFSREIKSINQAVSLFGMATIRGFALASMMQNNIKIDLTPYNLSKERFLNISLAQNALMFTWYSKVDRSMMDILMPASFLMEIGKIILAEELKEENKVKEFSQELPSRKTALDISQLEEDYLNISGEEMTAAILEHWNLEFKMVNAIRYSLEVEKANDEIKPYAIALNVVKNAINTNGRFKKDGLQESYNTIEDYELDREKFTRSLEMMGG
jgi:HD-like signal output (HDOD) protein